MHRSFSLVDHKVAEAEFFLRKLNESERDFFELRCYLSAFVSSTRSITFALQAVLKKNKSFDSWYELQQARLGADNLARFFNKFRSINQHIGENVANAGISGKGGKLTYLFTPTQDVQRVPEIDVLTACTEYFAVILNLIYDCYVEFGPLIDGRQRYTENYFAEIGKTIEDAEEELGFPRGWTDIDDDSAQQYRWQALRDECTGCEINHIFNAYLQKSSPSPARLPPYQSNGT